MQNFLESLQKALINKEWHTVLIISLMLPDVCGNITYGKRGRQRYIKWINTYFVPLSEYDYGRLGFNGGTCYALRCSLLHQGTSILDKNHRAITSEFIFSTPGDNQITFHMNRVNGKIQLQVDIFGTEMLKAVSNWWEDRGDKESVNSSLITIYDGNKSILPLISYEDND